MLDQNNIILILLLISVIVAFYAIYLSMENSKKIKKINIELLDLVKLVQQLSNIPNNDNHPPKDKMDEKIADNEYPTLDELNQMKTYPLDEELKRDIDNLELIQEDKEGLNNEENHNQKVLNDSENNKELTDDDNHNQKVLNDSENNKGLTDDENHEGLTDDENQEGLTDDENQEGLTDDENHEEIYPNLVNLTDKKLDEYNCKELKDICKREELRTRGRKIELIERILKKKNAVS